MPTITFDWNPFKPVDTAPYKRSDNTAMPWVIIVDWRSDVRKLKTTTPGIYIIENAADSPIYAGKAGNIRKRFDGRSNTLHELGFSTAVDMPQYQCWTTSVNSSPEVTDKIKLAESWVVRFLYVRDQTLSLDQFLNISLTKAPKAPADGLTIKFTKNQAPSYLTDSAMPGYKGVVKGVTTYRYTANSNVIG